MIIGSKNKGDWSEFYVFLYLLGHRKLYAADERLNKIDASFFPVKKIIRNDEPANKVDFILDGIDKVKIYENEKLLREMTSHNFINEANALYADILKGKGSFDIPRAERFLNEIRLKRLAAPSKDVTDILMELYDSNTGINQVMGFSIKSYIGATPTLLNASNATNFVYEIIGLNDIQINEINSINTKTKIIDKMNAILSNGGIMSYCKTVSDVFSGNLTLIDSRMEELLAELILYSYTTNKLDCKEIIERLEITNPLKYPRNGMYAYKFKQFLCAKALGMEPSVEWLGEDDANGGYIIAKSTGEVLAYHLYNRDKFKQYLFENVKLERGSTSKHNYANIYKENNKTYINLNLQIRFK